MHNKTFMENLYFLKYFLRKKKTKEGLFDQVYMKAIHWLFPDQDAWHETIIKNREYRSHQKEKLA